MEVPMLAVSRLLLVALALLAVSGSPAGPTKPVAACNCGEACKCGQNPCTCVKAGDQGDYRQALEAGSFVVVQDPQPVVADPLEDRVAALERQVKSLQAELAK